MTTELKTEVLGVGMVKMGDRELLIEFPLPAIAIAEVKLDGLNLRDPRVWLRLSAEKLPVLVEAGLSKHQSETAEADAALLCGSIGPETLWEFQYGLCKLAFPRYCELYEAALAKIGAGTAPDPKAQSGDGS